MPTYSCRHCSASFTRRTDNRKPTPVFCSTQCFGASNVRDHTKSCPRCQTTHTKEGTYCSRTCANKRPQSDETKDKIRASVKANPTGVIVLQRDNPRAGIGSRNPTPDVMTCSFCDKSYPRTNYKTLARKYCSEDCRQKAGKRGGYRENSTRCKRSEYQGFLMHSGSELEFAKLLDEHNIRWVKNSTTSFSFSDRTGKARKYYPDFYLPDFDHWVEIKGRRYLREDDDLRLAAVGNIERIMHDDIRLPAICTK